MINNDNVNDDKNARSAFQDSRFMFQDFNWTRRHEGTKKFNDNVNANLNFGFKSLFTLSG